MKFYSFSVFLTIFLHVLLVSCGMPKSSDQPGMSLTPAGTGQNFFNSNVVPMFQAECSSCHAFIFEGGNGIVSIFQYASMKQFLQTGGTTSSNNGLVKKMLNTAPYPHGASNLCFFGLNQTPCKEVMEWWNRENPNAGGTGNNDATGARQSYFDIGGVVGGWAADPDAPNLAATIKFYVGGPIGTGIPAGETEANLPKLGIPVSGNHGFSYALPTQFHGLPSNSLYIYVTDINTNQTHLLPGTPFNFVAQSPSAEATAYFQANVATVPGVAAGFSENNCAGCHSGFSTYIHTFAKLTTPSPSNGGTATNNILIQKLNGTLSHGGGNRCSGQNAQLCINLQTLWQCEFGSGCP